MPELFNNVYTLQVLVVALFFVSTLFVAAYIKQKGLLFAALHHDELLNDENNGMSKQIAALKDQIKTLQGLNDHQFDTLSKNTTTIESLENEVRFLRDQQNTKTATNTIVYGVPKQPVKRRNRTRVNHPGVGKSIP